MHWIGVDVGGTFTDVVVYDEDSGVLDVAKSPTSRADPTIGLLNALGKLPVALSTTGRIVYGTTIGTNAILERTGAPDSVDVGESDLQPLIAGEVDANEACHGRAVLLFIEEVVRAAPPPLPGPGPGLLPGVPLTGPEVR